MEIWVTLWCRRDVRAFDSSVFRGGGERRPRDVAAGLRIRRRFPTQCASHDRLLLAERLLGPIVNVNAVPRLP